MSQSTFLSFRGLTSTKQRIKCLAQGHNTVPLERLKPATPQSQVKHSTTEPLQSSFMNYSVNYEKLVNLVPYKDCREHSGRMLDLRPRGHGFEHHLHHCVVVLEQDTFFLA